MWYQTYGFTTAEKTKKTGVNHTSNVGGHDSNKLGKLIKLACTVYQATSLHSLTWIGGGSFSLPLSKLFLLVFLIMPFEPFEPFEPSLCSLENAID